MFVPRLMSPRLALEPLAVEHSSGMYALWSNAAVCEFSGAISDYEGNPIDSPVRHSCDSDKIIDFWRRARGEGWGFRWAITDQLTEKFLGTAGFNSLGPCSEYAYHLHPDYWHRGYMSEATTVAFEWVCDLGRCSEIEAFIEPPNERSIVFAERHGFRPTGEVSKNAMRFLKRAAC